MIVSFLTLTAFPDRAGAYDGMVGIVVHPVRAFKHLLLLRYLQDPLNRLWF